MKIKFLLIILLLLFTGCEKKSSLSVHEGDVYQEDREGNIYLIQGNKKYKIEEYKDELLVYNKFERTIEKRMYESNHTFDVLMKYLDDDCFYIIDINSKDDKFEETSLYKRFQIDSNKSFTVRFKESDGIVIKELMLSRTNIETVLVDSMGVTGYRWEGELNISKTLFNEIYKFDVSYNLPSLQK